MSDWQDALGLGSGKVTLVPYDPRWASLFEQAAAEIREAVGDRILSIEHVGSTSVPGLAAKPILDILVGVSDLERARELVPELTSLGYEYRPDEDIPDRHFFRRRVGGHRTHHLSLAEPTSEHYRKTIAFRDALRVDPALAREYERLKLELARRFPTDRQTYIEGKTEFVLRVLKSIRAA